MSFTSFNSVFLVLMLD
ncbi:hypothetical protein FWK35_00004916 [Aphis craccivora]|uniref:Uncharacterized protein n=1 Tax=Aphis craccivora TaxID=307492 RepID=A0A6G0ZDK0_APHCR|nr:hypothetical protein FWK35_00004916 [Aphis craccivora]